MRSSSRSTYEISGLTAQEERVRDRVGRDSSGLAKWLLKFAQTSLRKLSEGDWTNLKEELLLFSKGHITRSSAVISQFLPKRNRLHPLTNEEIEILQQFTLSKLQDIANHGRTYFQFKDFPLIACSDGESESMVIPVLTGPVDGFAYHLAHLLGEHAHRLKQCPECPRLYFSLRLHQKFCSPRCRSRAGTREFRKAYALAKSKQSTGKPH